MTKGNITKQLLLFAVPMMLGMLFQQLYNTVDTIVVGQFVGKQALAAVGSTGSIINMMVGFCSGLFTGAGVIISQLYGAHENEKLSAAVHTTLTITLILCVLATVLGFFIIDPMLRFMSTPEDVFASSRQYLSIYFSGITGLLIYNMGSGILRAVGDSKRPLYILCFSAVLNIIFDLLFVVCFHLGVAGVAYATILSQMLSALLVLYLLTREKAAYGIRWKKLCLRKDTAKKIFSLGFPSGFQQAVTSFSNVYVQGYINFFGSACMAGWAGYSKIDNLIMIPVQSIAMASATFVGQNYGAHQMDRSRQGVKKALTLCLSTAVVLSASVMIFATPLLRLFSPDEDIIAFGQKFIWMISPFFIAICFNQVFSGALRGIGNVKWPTAAMLFSFVIFRQIYLYVVSVTGNSFYLMAVAYPMGWIVCSILLSLLFKRSKLGKKHLSA